jgi:hypothetical protein
LHQWSSSQVTAFRHALDIRWQLDGDKEAAPFAVLGGDGAVASFDAAFGDGEAEAAAAGGAAAGGFGSVEGLEEAC